ncbi:hypothetical protein BC939DRAFT_492613 [Gamsiella multidivaricata]|uniref:uncharacterized protein n=1 Tax=Gamsiella multidivaricata TaxID=101098 RepID=UPI00221EAF09|nr:uncharacterized protein BC939DRAFT_492613 [Gamsiella multidivaricata]KAG0354614.1 hypothetical protein BGZ54_001562 [Gamsiella multidivaricata]KAI7824304.1 hypothetical protein BC939DRAFT_492613 [Gamsiella multidivaricata]
MFAPRPGVLRGVVSALNTASYLASLPEEGKGPWDNAKDTQEHYDYIVLGGGSAGCVMASRLAEDPKVKVLVLEAGYSDEIMSSRTPAVFILNVDSATDWQFKTTPQTHAEGRVMKQPRGKLLGGTSSINAMMYHRGPASDYDEWDSLGNPGWSYKECLPYFKKSEGFSDPNLPISHPKGPLTKRVRKSQYETHDPEYHGTEGPWQVTFHHLYSGSEGFIRANIAEGIQFNKDFNGESTLGVNRIQTFIQRNAVRSSLSRAFLKSKDIVPGGGARGKIRVVYGADIRRILVQMKKGVKMAYGVEFVDHKKVPRRVVAAREVLLCAGAFGSPHILLASGIGPSPQPSIPHVHMLPGVGANLADHLGLGVVFRARNRSHGGHQELALARSIISLLDYNLRGVGSLSSQVGEAVNFVRLEEIAPDFVAREKANGTYRERASGPHSPHIEIIFAPYFMRQHGTIMPADSKSYYTLIALLLNPCSAGTVTIKAKKSDSPSDGGPPEFETVIDPNYFSDAFDVRVMVEAVKFMRKLGRRMNQDLELGGREVFPGELAVPNHDDEKLQRFVRNSAETYYHPTSTCRMGPTSDPLAVVDSRLNVYGVDRLRVIDASVMPKLPAAHTCAPTVMIAERASDFIKEDWEDPSVRKGEPTMAKL